MTFRIEVFKGKETLPYIRTLSKMRVKEFCQFPYLYVGTVEDDYIYSKGYSLTPQGLLVVAFKNDGIAGLYSGMPMQHLSHF